jgi:glycosyltransferase involved in cell wall biosynthesis
MDSKKLLTFVFTGRNDDYLGNFKYRLKTAIEMLVQSANEINKLSLIEIIIVDWNSEVPLSEVLNLSRSAGAVTKFVIVPQAIAIKYSFEGKVFNAGCACNAGVRRATGEYITYLPADILISPLPLENLLRLLKGELNTLFDCKNTMLGVHAQILPWQLVEQEPSVMDWKRYIQISNNLIFKGFSGLCGGYAAFILHKNLWYQYQGVLENFRGWGWIDIEIGLRCNIEHPFVGLIGFGIFFSDMQQAPGERGLLTNHGNGPIPIQTTANEEGWGLHREILDSRSSSYIETFKDRPVYREFEPQEFPELLDRVDLPETITNLLKNQVIKRTESCLTTLLTMAALSEKKSWQKALVCGVKDILPTLYLLLLNPGIELYLIDEFEKDSFDDYGTLLMRIAKGDFKGYFHCLPGPIETSFARLEDAFIGRCEIEFALIDLDIYWEIGIGEILLFCQYLVDEGVLIYRSDSRDKVKNFAFALNLEFNAAIHMAYEDENIGIMVK